MGRRRGARRAGRRAGRRSARRMMRRRRRRRVMVGGMVLLAVGGAAAAVKLSQKDAQKIEEHTGNSVEELSDEELVAAMQQLGIQSAELSAADKEALAQDAASAEADDSSEQEEAPAEAEAASGAGATPAYIQELQQLAQLRDQGILTEEEFEAKKKQILGD